MLLSWVLRYFGALFLFRHRTSNLVALHNGRVAAAIISWKITYDFDT